ncbi:MAG TPA: hypothetical protein DCO75_04205 [Fibrobacteres bacterium]|nr:hypothetical protein [Fibrobacterota bacterium]
MIYDNIDKFNTYLCVHPMFTHILEFMAGHSIDELENGRTDICRGIYASVDSYSTKSEVEKMIECHRKYIDIQIVLCGKELIGVCNRSNCAVVKEYDPQKDVEFLSGSLDMLHLNRNNFIVLFPQDAHKPGIAITESAPVKKIVFKAPV